MKMDFKNLTVMAWGAVLASACLGTGASAGTLPEGMTKIDLSAGQAVSNELWYTTLAGADFTRTTDSGTNFVDRQMELGVTRGVSEHLELGMSVGFSNKTYAGNAVSDNGQTNSVRDYSTSGISYVSLKAKRGLLSSAESFMDLSGLFNFKYAADAGSAWYFQSPNDRSHHTELGLELGKPLPWGGMYLFASPKLIHRSHGRVRQWEASAGLVLPMTERLTLSGYYHILSSAEGTLCFHNPHDLPQFFGLPYGDKLSDDHQGPGAVVSWGVDDHVTVEAFSYMKMAGVNTDKSITFGANLSYVLF